MLTIRPITDDDIGAVVEFALDAWEPGFDRSEPEPRHPKRLVRVMSGPGDAIHTVVETLNSTVSHPTLQIHVINPLTDRLGAGEIALLRSGKVAQTGTDGPTVHVHSGRSGSGDADSRQGCRAGRHPEASMG